MSSPVGDHDRGRGKPAAAPPGRRAGLLLSGVAVLALVAGGGLYLTRGDFSSGTASGRPAASAVATVTAGVALAATPAMAKVPSRQATARAHPTGPATSAAAASGRAAPSTGAASAPASGPSTAQASGAAATAAAQGGVPAAQVLALINQARATAGLPALTETSGLDASASAHNLRMAGGCGLSHQCPGESALGARETAAGVGWTAAGENIGEGGPVADTTVAIAQMAVGLTQSMLNEQPPNDGHRMNILSSTFTHIGIAVDRDASGTVWLTQDFSN